MTPGGEEKAWLAIDDRSSSVDLPEELQQLVKPELQPGERLLWASKSLPKPSKDARFPLTGLYYATAFVALSIGTFYVSLGPLRLKLLAAEGVLLVAGSLAAIIGLSASIITIGSWFERWSSGGQAPTRIYALTDRRGIIWIPQKDSKAVLVHAIARGALRSLHRLEYPDGSGDVMFTYSAERSYQSPSGFEGVADVRLVEDLVRRTLLTPGPQPSA